MEKDYNPIFVMPESNPASNKSPQKKNIAAAKLVAETIRTTLGPKGMDKLLVNSRNEIIITNDGVTILEEMELDHPIAKMIVEIAQTQEDEVGDGTTTAVILAGELLGNAEELLDRGIHPAVINKGYRLAAEKAVEILDKESKEVKSTDRENLKKIVQTAMTGKGAEVVKHVLSDIVVDAVLKVAKNPNAGPKDIQVQKKIGGVEKCELITGIILDKGKVHSDMPSRIENAKIALLNCPLEVRDTETSAKISINNPTQIQEFLDQEERIIKAIAVQIIKSGANVVLCQKGIDDLAQYFLAKEGIMAIRRVKQSDMEKLAKASGAKIIFDIKELDSTKLGTAKLVEEQNLGEEVTYITGCKNDNVSAILVSGGTDHVAEEVRRAIEDAIGDLFAILKSKKAVAGAGAIEIELSRQIMQYSKTLVGREQLAVKAFAKSLESIPKTLAENAGLDPIDVITELSAQHEKGFSTTGIDVFTGKAIDAWKEGIIEPVDVKLQAIRSASEVANMILRIDDVIIAQTEMPQQRAGGPRVRMPPGMDDM